MSLYRSGPKPSRPPEHGHVDVLHFLFATDKLHAEQPQPAHLAHHCLAPPTVCLANRQHLIANLELGHRGLGGLLLELLEADDGKVWRERTHTRARQLGCGGLARILTGVGQIHVLLLGAPQRGLDVGRTRLLVSEQLVQVLVGLERGPSKKTLAGGARAATPRCARTHNSKHAIPLERQPTTTPAAPPPPPEARGPRKRPVAKSQCPQTRPWLGAMAGCSWNPLLDVIRADPEPFFFALM